MLFAAHPSRRYILWAAAALAGLVATDPAAAQDAYPSRPITIVVPYAAGGFSDIRARQIGERLAKAMGVAVVIENKGGAGGVIGTNQVAKASPDGYTLGTGNLAPLAVNVSLMTKLPYDPATDVVPIILLEKSPLILTAGLPLGVSTVADLIAKGKAAPGTLNYGSSGVGGAHHLSGAMFAHQTGLALAHVPYRGGSAAANDLLAGHISIMFEMGYAALSTVEAGKIKALAVTSSKRLAKLPAVPTIAESGLPGFESYNWQGIIAPKGTPPAIVARLSSELNKILATPDMRDAIESQASEVVGGTPETFAAFIKAETAKWAEVVKAAGLKVE